MIANQSDADQTGIRSDQAVLTDSSANRIRTSDSFPSNVQHSMSLENSYQSHSVNEANDDSLAAACFEMITDQ
jgi:hypothetical protein